jgi:hypothetical protein
MCSLKNISENIYLSVSYDFSKLDESRKSRCNVPSGTTQEWTCPLEVHKGSYAMEKGMLGCQTFTIRN